MVEDVRMTIAACSSGQSVVMDSSYSTFIIANIVNLPTVNLSIPSVLVVANLIVGQ